MKKVEIYTDGACSGNPGKGGWAAILIYKGYEKEHSGNAQYTTNNRMELMAVIEGLSLLKEPCKVSLYSDSAYVVQAFNNGWIYGWHSNNWMRAKNEDVKNRDLWEELLALTKSHYVTFIKVKGHSDNEYNNRCDALARAEIKKLTD
ncbi:MAG: ribonuclease HI [Clostridia bacterium]